MSMLKDEDMKEVVDGFCEESLGLLQNCESLLDQYEDTEDTKYLEEFGQTIDRIMGAAKSLDAEYTGSLTELGKIISYKASQVEDEKILEITSAILYDLLDVQVKVIKGIQDEYEEKVDGLNLAALKTRFEWLADKLKHIKRGSVAFGDKGEDQKSIDELLKNLGL